MMDEEGLTRTVPIAGHVWEAHKEVISQLYKKYSLRVTIEKMSMQYKFHATSVPS
jgi:hypothetical protein